TAGSGRDRRDGGAGLRAERPRQGTDRAQGARASHLPKHADPGRDDDRTPARHARGGRGGHGNGLRVAWAGPSDCHRHREPRLSTRPSGRRLHGDDLRPHQSGRRRCLRVLGSADPVPLMSGDAMMPSVSLGSPGVSARRWTATPRGRRLLRMGVLLIAVAIAGLGAPVLVPYDPLVQRLEQHLLPPGTRLSDGQIAWLGTDQLGRDLGGQVVHGARISMLVASSTVVLAGVSGTALGLCAGYYGGTVDTVIMRLADLQLSFPALLLAILIAAILEPSVLNVILILSVIRWAVFTRLAYGSV